MTQIFADFRFRLLLVLGSDCGRFAWNGFHASLLKEEHKETAAEVEEKEKLAELISSTRIMTDEDFKVISAKQVAKDITSARSVSSGRKAKKRKQQEAFDGENRLVGMIILCCPSCISCLISTRVRLVLFFFFFVNICYFFFCWLWRRWFAEILILFLSVICIHSICI